MLAQSFEDFELLLIGHDDVDTATVGLPDDHRIQRLSRQAPGIVGALNTGLANARGRYIARMDDDDIAFARVRAGRRTGAHDRRQRRYARHSRRQSTLRTVAEWTDPQRHAASVGIYRKPATASHMGVTFAKPEATLLDWRDHQDRLTRTDPRYSREAFIEMKADALTHPESLFALGNKHSRGVWIAGVGRSARRWCDALLARGVAVRGFVDLAGPKMRNQKRRRPVVDYDGLLDQRGDDLLLGAVTRPEARESLAAWCTSASLKPLRDYVLGD